MKALGAHTYMPCGAPGTATRELVPLHGGGSDAVTGSGSTALFGVHMVTVPGP